MTTLAIYCVLIVAISVAAGFVTMRLHLDHRRMQFVLSLIGGAMFGVALFHMIPHAIVARAEAVGVSPDPHDAGHQLVDPLVLAVALGFLAMFLLERFFSHHHHEVVEEDASATDGCGHDHGGPPATPHGGKLGWLGATIGMAIHTMLAGVALGSSVLAALERNPADVLPGLATFLVIILHKPFDVTIVVALVKVAGFSSARQHLVNAILALALPLGVAIVLVLATQVVSAGSANVVLAPALAFSAGVFICVALSDLLPELHFHRHDRVGLSAALIVGMALAWGLGVLEQAGGHGHAHDHGAHGHDHGHGHSHGPADPAPAGPEATPATDAEGAPASGE